MNKVEKSPQFLRAKLVDEPYVREMLTQRWSNDNIDFILPTKEEDWNHADIIQVFKDNPNSKIYYDVKRNCSTGIHTPNFLFGFKSHNGNLYKFNVNGYFAYIDDETGDVILIHHITMQEFVETYKHHKNKTSLSEYILIPKTVMRERAYAVLKGNKNCIKYLAANRDETLFNGLF